MAAIVLFCLALLVCIVLRANILYALLAGLVIFALYGKKQGFSWKELGKMICSGVKTSASVLLVFPLIGILTAFQIFLIKARINKRCIIFAFQESCILQYTLMERNRCFNSQNLILAQSTCHIGNGRSTGTPPTT